MLKLINALSRALNHARAALAKSRRPQAIRALNAADQIAAHIAAEVVADRRLRGLLYETPFSNN